MLYPYGTGQPSSRKIDPATYDAVPYRVLAAVRQQHLHALAGRFLPVLLICQRAGRVKRGHVACAGSPVLANASKHTAMSYGRIEEAERKRASGDRGAAGAGPAGRCRRDKDILRDVRQAFKEYCLAPRSTCMEVGLGQRASQIPTWIS